MPQDPLELLEAYVDREGHALVPKGHIEDEFALGQWVAKRRLAYQQGRSDPERSSRLEKLPGWSWTPQDDRWQRAYEQLLRFVEREGHALVRQDVVEDGLRLGVWVWEQRRAHKAGRLNPERTSKLTALPGWVWDATMPRWEQRYATLVDFVERTGNARVPHRHIEGEVHLGQWVQTQRKLRRRGRLPPERTDRLDALPGWSWGSRRATTGDAASASPVSSRSRRSRSRDPAEDEDGEWLDMGRASALCGLSRQTIRRLVEDGKLPASGRGREVRIHRSAVDAFIRSSRISGSTLVRGNPSLQSSASPL
jgi:excisionase family DNA binding protein